MRDVTHAEAAMAAGVVVGVNAAIGGAGDDERIAADLEGEEIAGARDLAIMAGEDPLAVEEMLEVELVERRAAVEIAGQGMALRAMGELVEHVFG
jgi:hypothetical protein